MGLQDIPIRDAEKATLPSLMNVEMFSQSESAAQHGAARRSAARLTSSGGAPLPSPFSPIERLVSYEKDRWNVFIPVIYLNVFLGFFWQVFTFLNVSCGLVAR